MHSILARSATLGCRPANSYGGRAKPCSARCAQPTSQCPNRRGPDCACSIASSFFSSTN